MGIFGILKQLPSYASDIQENLTDIFIRELEHLTKTQIYGIALTVGYSLKHEYLLNCIRSEAKMYLEQDDATACKVASITISMTSVYHKFNKEVEDKELRSMHSKLKMSQLAIYGNNQPNFDMYCLAISILNGCRYCMNIHINKLLNAKVSKETIQHIARIVAVLQATRDTLEIEGMRSYDFLTRGEGL